MLAIGLLFLAALCLIFLAFCAYGAIASESRHATILLTALAMLMGICAAILIAAARSVVHGG